MKVREAVNEIKAGNAPRVDGIPVECLKKGGMAMLEWLVRLLNLSVDTGVVPMDWRGACIVPLYKGKGDKCECSNSRGISLLSVVGKLCGRALIVRVRARTECAIRKELCEFRQGRGCMDLVFAAWHLCEKYLANWKDVFWAFMDLEKVYDIRSIDQHGMWQMLRVYGVGGKLMKPVQSFYAELTVFVRVGNYVSEWFQVNIGLRQGCMLSSWLFNVYIVGGGWMICHFSII